VVTPFLAEKKQWEKAMKSHEISHDSFLTPLWKDIQLATGSDWCGIALLKIHWLFSGRVN